MHPLVRIVCSWLAYCYLAARAAKEGVHAGKGATVQLVTHAIFVLVSLWRWVPDCVGWYELGTKLDFGQGYPSSPASLSKSAGRVKGTSPGKTDCCARVAAPHDTLLALTLVLPQVQELARFDKHRVDEFRADLPAGYGLVDFLR